MLAQMPPLQEIRNVALFLDFNGTLAPIVGELVLSEMPAGPRQVLDHLEAVLDGRLVIVSGPRSRISIDRASPLYLPCRLGCPERNVTPARANARYPIDDYLHLGITRPVVEFVRVHLA